MAEEYPPDVIWLRRERAGTGRPPLRSREEITAAAIGIADREGLDAVSMRRVAADLGTGAASLYRYLDTRDDLLDLMADAVASEYGLPEPCGDWLADLIEVARQARSIMLRRTWVPDLIITGAASGIGRATALIFARERANVVCADINETGGRDTAAAACSCCSHCFS